MRQIEIRPTVAADAQAVSGLLRASYGRLLQTHYDSSVLAAALPLIARARPDLLESGTYFVGVRSGDGEAIGCGGWTRNGPRGEHVVGRAHIRHFATSPSCVRSGVGSAILRRCLDEIRAAGMVEVECVSTLMAEPFYARAGFRREASDHVRLGEDVVFPAVRMLLRW